MSAETEWWQQVRQGSAGPARHRHAAALHDARLYVHGGQCDLRDCADLWYYDTREYRQRRRCPLAPGRRPRVIPPFPAVSRTWTQVRTPAKLSPGARSGHAGLRAGAHFYIFGGEANGHPTNELWRFHFGKSVGRKERAIGKRRHAKDPIFRFSDGDVGPHRAEPALAVTAR